MYALVLVVNILFGLQEKVISFETEKKAVKRYITLFAGEDKVIDLKFTPASANAISYGNPQLVTTTLVTVGKKKHIVFKPLKEGSTTVSIHDEEGELRIIFHVTIAPCDLLKLKSQLQILLEDIENLELQIVGKKVVLKGELLVTADYGKVIVVLSDKEYADNVLNLTTLSAYALRKTAEKIQKDVNLFAPNVTTRLVNGSIFLEGNVDNLDQAKRAEKLAFYYLPEIRPALYIEKDPSAQRMPTPRPLIQNFIVINPPPPKKEAKLVRITVHFVELTKDYASTFGFKWAPGFTTDGPQISIGPNANGTNAPTIAGTLSSLLPKLQTAEQSGYARILRTGTVVVRSGQPAKLNETQDFPFTLLGQNGQVTASSKEVGLSLSLTPNILGKTEDIDMDLEMTQSSVIARGNNGAPPSTANHKVSTKLYVKSSESAAIAGVSSHDTGTDFNKDDPSPDGGSGNTTIPIVTLLHSKSYRKKKSQFVIFITPQILENASDGTEDLKANFRIKVH